MTLLSVSIVGACLLDGRLILLIVIWNEKMTVNIYMIFIIMNRPNNVLIHVFPRTREHSKKQNIVNSSNGKAYCKNVIGMCLTSF